MMLMPKNVRSVSLSFNSHLTQNLHVFLNIVPPSLKTGNVSFLTQEIVLLKTALPPSRNRHISTLFKIVVQLKVELTLTPAVECVSSLYGIYSNIFTQIIIY